MSATRRDFLKTAAAFAALGVTPELIAEKDAPAKKPAPEAGRAGTPEPLPAPADEAGALRFLVMGDWGWAGVKPKEGKDPYNLTLGQVADAKGMSDTARERSAGFILSVGDNFYPNGVTSTDDPRWQISFEQVYNAPSLQVPWYVALGNHDYRGNVPAQIAYSRKSSRWRMPARHYTFIEKSAAGVTAQFFILDTCPFVPGYARGGHSDVGEQKPVEQLAWLERELAASSADWKIVVGHHPLWSGGVRRATPEELLGDRLGPILRRHGVQAYFCGHEHDAQHIERDGLHCFVHGNGCEGRPTGAVAGTRFAESRVGFGYVTADSKALTVNFLDVLGEVRHTAKILRRP